MTQLPGQCRKAFEFYARVPGGKVTAAMPYSDGPPDMPISDDKYASWLMHCWLEVGDQALMGADMDVDWAPNVDKPKNGFDVTLHTEDAAEARRWFDALSDAGSFNRPRTTAGTDRAAGWAAAKRGGGAASSPPP